MENISFWVIMSEKAGADGLTLHFAWHRTCFYSVKWGNFVMFLLRKIPKEIYIYIAWGVLVGAVNLGSSWFLIYECHINEIYANYIAWILYNFVSFATNRKSVFHTKAKTAKAYIFELILFYISRISTLLIETGIIYVFVTRLGWYAMGVKVFTSVLVIFLNYFISKKFIFSIPYKGAAEKQTENVKAADNGNPTKKKDLA